jgi:glycosyltransferase involved in cell wall biosynthesis
VRLRARTVHTSLDGAPEWRGHPTRLFEEQARHGESPILPTFGAKAVWTATGKEEGEKSSSAVILAAAPSAALREALEESGTAGVLLTGAVTDSTLRRGGVLFAGGGPSDALLAAYLTMQGVPVIAASATPFLSALLGGSGYIVPRTADREGWRTALEEAASEAGRASAASARRFLKERYGPDDAAKALENLYRAVTGGKFR